MSPSMLDIYMIYNASRLIDKIDTVSTSMYSKYRLAGLAQTSYIKPYLCQFKEICTLKK